MGLEYLVAEDGVLALVFSSGLELEYAALGERMVQARNIVRDYRN